MRETVRHDAALCFSLQPVVTDRGGRDERFLEVARLQHLSLPVGRVAPHTREAIGLQFLAHRETVAACVIEFCSGLLHLRGHAEQGLHVMAHLVCDHIGLREITGGPEALLQIIEEGEIEIDLPVARAVEGANRGTGRATGRAHAVAEEHQTRLLIALSRLGEDRAPAVFGVGKHHRDELSQLLFFGRDAARCAPLGYRCADTGQRVDPQHAGARIADQANHQQHATAAGAEEQGKQTQQDERRSPCCARAHFSAQVVDVVAAAAVFPAHPASPVF